MKKFYKFIPILVILVSVIVFFYPFVLQGKLPIPSDTIVGLYHPFRDLYADTNPNGLPYKNFLITDPVRQQYPWKNLVISLEKKFQLPLWNPYVMAGTPLLANFQSSPFYPLNILLFIPPFSISWSLFIFIQPILSGLFLYFYLRNLKVDPRAALLGSLTWAFCGFTVAWLEWGTIVHTMLWLPLILLSIDEGFLKKNIKWKLVFIFSLSASFFAGHLQVFFYVFIFTLVYFLARLFSIKNKLRILFSFVFDILVVAGITFIQWWPTFQFILLSNRTTDQSFTQPGWFIPWQNLIQFIAPDFFGNPSTLNYFGVWNYAEFIGYVGIASLIVFLYSILFRHDKKTYFFGGALLVSLIFALPTVISSVPFLVNIPLISTAQPTRLLVISCFSLAVLAALGLDLFLKKKTKIWIPIVIFGFFILVFWGVTFFGSGYYSNSQDILVSRSNLKFPTILFIGVSTLLMAITFLKKKKYETVLFSFLIILVLFDLVRFGWKFTPFTNSQYLFPSTKVIEFLQNQKGIFRIAATDSRILPPNFSVIYKLQSIEGYDPLYLKSYAALIAASERGRPDINSPFGFNRIITPRNLDSKIIDLLNVKYVLSLTDLNSEKFKKVFQEGETRIYENKDVLPRAFFVSTVYSKANKESEIKNIFKNINALNYSAVIEEKNVLKIGSPDKVNPNNVKILEYSDNRVVIETESLGMPADLFLVLTDAYYPTWKVKIDGKLSKIYKTDYAFRGIIVPSGKHTIVFYNSLF